MLILASGSPRRSGMLDQLGFRYTQRPPQVPEIPRKGEDPHTMVRRFAYDKAAAATAGAGDVVLGIDTTVVLDGESLGKPRDGREAVAMLLRLSGRDHIVLSGWVLRSQANLADGWETTTVTFLPIDREEASAYVEGGEPMDKAGAYAIQGEGGRFVAGIEGSFSNVMGFPMEALVPALARFGITPSTPT